MAKKNRMTIQDRDGVTVLDLGEMEIWDGADLALLRETLTNLIEREECRSIGVEMCWVKYIPSGFFGMLYDWHDRGVNIQVYSPLPHVQNMLWFRQFFHLTEGETFALHSEPKEEQVPPLNPQWSNNSTWTEQRQDHSIATPSGSAAK